MPYNIITAFDLHRGIGKNNQLPWNIPEELNRFSKLTKGSGNNAIIMGRKTWDSIPRQPLPLRDNLILSHNLNIEYNTPKSSLVKSFKTIDEIKLFCCEQNYDNVWIIGGAQIYKLFMDEGIINYIYITRIIKNYNCDTTFPIILMFEHVIEHSTIKTKDNIQLIYEIYSITPPSHNSNTIQF